MLQPLRRVVRLRTACLTGMSICRHVVTRVLTQLRSHDAVYWNRYNLTKGIMLSTLHDLEITRLLSDEYSRVLTISVLVQVVAHA